MVVARTVSNAKRYGAIAAVVGLTVLCAVSLSANNTDISTDANLISDSALDQANQLNLDQDTAPASMVELEQSRIDWAKRRQCYSSCHRKLPYGKPRRACYKSCRKTSLESKKMMIKKMMERRKKRMERRKKRMMDLAIRRARRTCYSSCRRKLPYGKRRACYKSCRKPPAALRKQIMKRRRRRKQMAKCYKSCKQTKLTYRKRSARGQAAVFDFAIPMVCYRICQRKWGTRGRRRRRRSSTRRRRRRRRRRRSSTRPACMRGCRRRLPYAACLKSCRSTRLEEESSEETDDEEGAKLEEESSEEDQTDEKEESVEKPSVEVKK